MRTFCPKILVRPFAAQSSDTSAIGEEGTKMLELAEKYK